MVLALKGSDGLRPLTEQSARKWLEAYEEKDGSYPEPMLDWFPKLYDKVKSDVMDIHGISRRFVPTEGQDNSVRSLNDWRGNFVHFVPKGLLLDVATFPSMIVDVVDIMHFLAFESNNVLWVNDSDESKTKSLLDIVRAQAYSLKTYYGA